MRPRVVSSRQGKELGWLVAGFAKQVCFGQERQRLESVPVRQFRRLLKDVLIQRVILRLDALPDCLESFPLPLPKLISVQRKQFCSRRFHEDQKDWQR